jgi:hypothetical protein
MQQPIIDLYLAASSSVQGVNHLFQDGILPDATTND